MLQKSMLRWGSMPMVCMLWTTAKQHAQSQVMSAEGWALEYGMCMVCPVAGPEATIVGAQALGFAQSVTDTLMSPLPRQLPPML